MPIRRNLTTLSDDDLDACVQAILALKAAGEYDEFVTAHATATMRTPQQAHMSPMFLPWHRQFVRAFELALGPSFALPYWDWAADQALPDPTKGKIWDDDFMGGEGDPVTTGPFRQGQWTLAGGGPLVRAFGSPPMTLPSAADVDAALAVNVYDAPPWNDVAMAAMGYESFRNQLEGWLLKPTQAFQPQLHNRVHVWVGGSMDNMETSPNDPVFFLHHANIDRIWSRWQAMHPTSGYLPAAGVPGVSAGDVMWPWDVAGSVVTPDDVLSTNLLGYVYDSEIQRSATAGGPHGDAFDDSTTIEFIPAIINSVSATWNTVITSLSTNYKYDGPAPHGTPVSDHSGSVTVPPHQTIQAITVYTHKDHDKTGVAALSIEVSGQPAQLLGPAQTTAGQRFAAPPGTYIAGFVGRASNRIYSLGVVALPMQQGF
ncbi:tyrosinase family protein [Cellulomonas sp.]|uniref:tyrosinase family protein n=1 Tax=Cellulomonas sp. TaxID=40001 RepID=UPI001B0B6012|nr:tyrosinase family protein [Cellulomonas sp.]MBO9556266.1 tyrosinase family protein [Cellulomonas sp.]